MAGREHDDSRESIPRGTADSGDPEVPLAFALRSQDNSMNNSTRLCCVVLGMDTWQDPFAEEILKLFLAL